MDIEPSKPTTKNPPEQFAGDVWLDPIAAPHEQDQRMVVAKVRFAPGARTAWHSHARGQYLHVTQGVAHFGGRDGQIIEVHAGQTLYTPPGEEHFHAAATAASWNTSPCSNPATPSRPPLSGCEHVTDEDYPPRG